MKIEGGSKCRIGKVASVVFAETFQSGLRYRFASSVELGLRGDGESESLLGGAIGDGSPNLSCPDDLAATPPVYEGSLAGQNKADGTAGGQIRNPSDEKFGTLREACCER
jgi:hypothetical protein